MPASQGAPAQATFTPAADQSTVKHLRLTVISATPLHPHGLHLQVRCGDVGFPVTITSPGAPAIRPGDALVMEHRKGDNPLTCQPTAIYPAHQKPEPRKEPAVNLAIATSAQTITMTSLELVEYINSTRKEGEPELLHKNGINFIGNKTVLSCEVLTVWLLYSFLLVSSLLIFPCKRDRLLYISFLEAIMLSITSWGSSTRYDLFPGILWMEGSLGCVAAGGLNTSSNTSEYGLQKISGS